MGEDAVGQAKEGRAVPGAMPATMTPGFWLALVVVAVATGLAGGALMRLLFLIQDIAWRSQARGLYDAVAAASPARKLVVLLLAGGIVVAGLAVLRFAKGGHGGDVVVAIWEGDGRLPAVQTLARALLSIVVVGLGAAVGREGALKQTGAVAGWQVAHRLRLDADQRRILAACGAGAGMAAAYNIPLGGAALALEVMLGTAAWPVAVPAIACAAIATVASWALLPMRTLYSTPPYPLSLNLVLWPALAGPLIGLASVAYVRLVAWADRKRTVAPAWRVAGPLAVYALLGAGAIVWPELVGNGKDVVQLAFDGGGDDPRLHAVGLIAGLLLVRAIATALCFRTGTPGGLFTPTLTAGALLGLGAGHLWSHLFPGDPPGGYAAIGCAAMVAATTGGPISAIVSVLELGQNINGLVAPIVLASAGACFVMRMADAPSIYTVRLPSAKS